MKQWLVILTVGLSLCFPSLTNGGNKKKADRGTIAQKGSKKSKKAPFAKKSKRRNAAQNYCYYLRSTDGRVSLRATRASQPFQNEVADAEGRKRVLNRRMLESMKANGELVQIRATRSITFDPELPLARRYALPHVPMCLGEIADEFYLNFKKPLKINSAVRTAEVQLAMRGNPNAAPAHGRRASAHLTGAVLDIATLPNTVEQNMWLARTLLRLMTEGKVIAIVECKGRKVFHVYFRKACARR